MRETIVRFFLIQPLNEHPLVYWGILTVWLIMIGNCIASLRAQPMSLAAKWTWFLLIVLIPIIGMFFYLLLCLIKADYSFLKFILGPPKKVQSQLVK